MWLEHIQPKALIYGAVSGFVLGIIGQFIG
ncbi:hypothetical protein N783_19045 [Pontibacillus marinus BH030004 = DSM 16465]|uniref:Uncharacterized protein n=1 Tax=Pontibacillus marinus BH030004 = DSM 16465 TaxID=1385511 RepID=A0A0A5FTN5_9BACI|nr:hypothetical protein N783_19045 [Pontibacillus marinus BH030004 = DSM 16465]